MKNHIPPYDTLFYTPAPELAPALLGMTIIVNSCAGRIVETEAYTGPPEDLASHAHTRKNSAARIMQTAGRVYIYSIHGGVATNITCGNQAPGAVLIRAIEPLRGITTMIERRSRKPTKISQTWNPNNHYSLRTMTNGPSKLTQALGIQKSWNDSLVGEKIQLAVGNPPDTIRRSTRIGISKARDLRWRYCDAESDFLSRPVK